MTNTLPSENGAKPRPKRTGKESAVGLQKHKRTATDIGLALITPIVGQEFLDRYNLRDPLNRSPEVRRQAGVLRGRRVDPAVQAHPRSRQARRRG